MLKQVEPSITLIKGSISKSLVKEEELRRFGKVSDETWKIMCWPLAVEVLIQLTLIHPNLATSNFIQRSNGEFLVFLGRAIANVVQALHLCHIGIE